ncbi:PEP-CTERM putative exosortase interaction domain-containing protein [Opitutaceae bacterium TAV1]|nr:PEP-CTERM putative exosortase interaction domain-containing protein [Opitutaceae bacterium TAV1]
MARNIADVGTGEGPDGSIAPGTVPVAICTRVSTEGQVGGRFDSCESQAVICRETIRRQSGEGWFEVVTGLSGGVSGMFEQGELITINGADFQIVYEDNHIVLQQLTAVPEPAAWAALTGAVLLVFAVVRRRRRRILSITGA